MRPCRPIALLLALTAAAGAPAATTEAGSPDDAAATVGTVVISRLTVDAAAQAQLDEAQRAHDSEVRRLDLRLAVSRDRIRQSTVEQILNDRALAVESAASGVSREALLAKVRVPAVTEAAVRSFYDARQRQIAQPFDRVQSQIHAYLEKQARDQAESTYLKSLRDKHHAQSRIEPLRLTIRADGPGRGPVTAPVTVVEFADFQCPYCGDMEPVLRELRAAYPTQVRWVYRHLPLISIHPLALSSARAAVCADRQGRFWDLHDALFADQSALADDAVMATARRIGLDGDALEHCLASGAPEDQVAADTSVAEALGIGGTPAFFINGRYLNGTVSAGTFREIIDDELVRQKAVASAGGRTAAR
jgi:protein-disulfide isomerase